MTRRKTIDQLTHNDIRVLYMINKLRFVTMEQFRMIGGFGKSYTFEKSREYQRVGAITTKDANGYDFNSKKNKSTRGRKGKYLKPTRKAITLVRNAGYSAISNTHENNNVRKDRVLAILEINDLVLKIMPFGWNYLDGRETKRKHKTSIKNALIHGSLISPDGQTEQGVYMLMNEDNNQTNDIIKQQTPQFDNLTSFTVITRTATSVFSTIQDLDSSTIKYYGENIPKLQIGGKLRVLPLKFAQIYLPVSRDVHEQNRAFIEALGFQVLVDLENDKKMVENNDFSRRRFDYVVRHPDYGENKADDFYLVDMLDNDLTKMRDVANYTMKEQKDDGRKVIILTTNQEFHKPIHEQYIYGEQFIFHPIKVKDVVKIRDNLYPDVEIPEGELK